MGTLKAVVSSEISSTVRSNYFFKSFQAKVPYMGPEKGSFFMGVYLPQKSVLSPPIDSQYKPFQKHVSSYQVKRSPGCFVWAAPTLLNGAIIKKSALNLLRGANASEYRCGIRTRHV
jgi:hypothetical protein